MNRKLKIGLILIICMILFYALGAYFYEQYYRFQLLITSLLSGQKIHFFGKFPFWFFGDPNFRLITALIPFLIFLPSLISKKYEFKTYLIGFAIILGSILICSLIFGYIDSINILKNRETIRIINNKSMVPLNEISPNLPYSAGILFGFVLLSLINFKILKK